MSSIERRGRHTLVCTFAVAGHVLFVLALLRLEEVGESRAPDESVWTELLLDIIEREPDAPREPPPTGSVAADAAGATAEADAKAPNAAASPSQPATTQPALRQRDFPVDWYAEARAVAREAAKKATTDPVNPFAHRYPKPPGRPPPSVFRPEVVNKGRIVRNADGERIIWINENCYISLGSDSIALRDVHAAHRNVTFCRIPLGKRQARGDLFERMPNHGPVDLDAPLPPR
ncbi:MAG: hypothetical protein KAX84_17920 [Burkholderiales bacterium]|nr:hypothetical protein [Burkholderiales bacterium]